MGQRYLKDVLETMGAMRGRLRWFAGGSFSLMPRRAVQELIELCHAHEVLVSTGGFIEYVLTQGREAVDRYIAECRDLGFDIVEISAGFITLAIDDWLRLVERVRQAGLKPKPEVGIQFGAGGPRPWPNSKPRERAIPNWPSPRRRLLEAGYMIMIESEGITENVRASRHRRGGENRRRFGAGTRYVRGRRSRGLRLVH